MNDCRILVVEDSRTQAEALRDLLEKQGASVEVAETGEAAIERLAQERHAPPDLVLTDIVMPGLSGYDITRRIKTDPAFDRVPVVLLTSLADPLDIVRGLECGADNYVTKPYDPDYLIARLKYVLGHKRLSLGRRASLGVEVQFLGTSFTINSDREQILDLFLSSVEDVVRTNSALVESQRELAEAQRQLETYARQMAERAYVSSEQLRAVIEASPVAIVALDANANATLWNPAAERIFGFPAQEVLGTRPPIVPPEAQEEFKRDMMALADGATVRTQAGARTKAGGRVDVIVSAAALRDEEGRPVGSMAIIEDVTERKRTTAALAASQAQLVQAQKMEVIGTLAGGIAHDFNNLLTVIRSYSAMLVEELPQGDGEHAHFASEILAAAERAAGLTRQLLAFSRKQVLQPRLVSVDETISGVQKMLRRLVPASIDMRFTPAASGRAIRMDPGQLEQVLMNLVINASQAIPQGGLIEVRTRVDRVAAARDTAIGPIAPGTYVVVSVADTGTGMDQDTLVRLFEPFFTTKPAGTGTGLGLAVVRNVVAEQRGGIDVRSAPGEGTTFDVYLPLTAAEAPTPAPHVSEVPTGTEVVLVVDDDDAVRGAVRLGLERFGYTVLEAHDGTQALRVAEMLSTPPDLLLTDLHMPAMGGGELLQELGRNGALPKVLLMSGSPGDDPAFRSTRTGARHPFIQKPFTRESLARRVREVLDAAPPGTP